MIGRRQLILAAAILGLAAVLVSADPPSPAPFKKIESKRLPNAFWITDNVISGGLPDGDEAFQELKELGVKTILSVDGARPNLAAAKKYGLRYVHLPFGYNGIPSDRMLGLATAVRDLPGPIYVHCHHGKNRSPAATATVCVTLGTLDNAAALSVLKTAGTAAGLRGLFQAVESARPVDASVLDRLKVDFPESVDVPPLTDAMVIIDETHDHLGKLAAAGWRSPADQPDLEPAHEADLLGEQFAALLSSQEAEQRPKPFQELLRTSAASARELAADIRAGRDAKHLGTALERVSNNCKECHQKYRDVPLNNKQ